jgi:hypothetical protein
MNINEIIDVDNKTLRRVFSHLLKLHADERAFSSEISFYLFTIFTRLHLQTVGIAVD